MSEKAQPHATTMWPLLMVCALLVAGVILRPRASATHVPQPLPPLMAEGWLNTTEAGAPQVQGKVVVLDAWFTTCPPCLASMPTLAAIHRDYADDQRVAFVGLTFETKEKLPQIKEVIARVDGFDWPVGYGASPTLDMLGVQGFPTLIVFDQSGASVWSGHDVRKLRAALEKVL